MGSLYHYPIVAFCFLTSTSGVSAGDWNRFRGPNGSGVYPEANLSLKWTDKDYNWKARLPGPGHSSPVLCDKRIFVTCGEEKTGKRILLCIHADTGKTIWQHSIQGEKDRKHRDNSFASSTPAVDDKRVYVCWGGAKEHLVIALDHEGAEKWRRDLGPFKSGHGFGISPIVHENVLVIPNDQSGPSSLIALEADTGKVKWNVPRESKTSYSTPCIVHPKGQAAQLIFTNYERGISSIDPKTGKVNWEIDVFHKGHVETAISSPIVTNDLILATCGWMGVRQEVVAVRAPASQEEQPTRLYDLHRSAPLCTTPLVKDDLLFLWSDYGVVTCADVRTGKVHWRERVKGSYYSSPVCAGRRLYNVSRSGDVIVLSASKEYRLLAENALDEGTHSTPALAHGRMYLRTFTQLISLGGEKTK